MMREPAVVLVSLGAMHVLARLHRLRLDLEHGGVTATACRYAYVVPDSVYDGASTSAEVWDAVIASQHPLSSASDAIGMLVHTGGLRERHLTSLIVDSCGGWKVSRLRGDVPHLAVTEEKVWVVEGARWERLLPEGQRQVTEPPAGVPRVGRELGGAEVICIVRLAPQRAAAVGPPP